MRYRVQVLFVLAAAVFAGMNLSHTASAQRRVFSHTTAAHRTGKYANCGSCHAPVTRNWNTVRADKEVPFPDTRNFPSHESCFGCHTKDIYSNGGAFCGTCHTQATMRARALLAFPVKSHPRQFDIIFPHDKHQDLIAENIRPQTAFAPAHFVATTMMMSDDDKPKVSFYNCAICHQTRDALPKFAARKISDEKPLAEAAADVFIKPVTAQFFKDSPNNHASCFQCHYQFANLPAGKNNCNGCHAPAKAFYEGKTVERYSIKFDHNRVGHGEKDCTSCHIRITQNASVALMRDADVPITSCKSCHATQEDDPSKKILLTEIDEREKSVAAKKPVFQCTYCHTSAVGRFDIPASHKLP
jgi:hypothetical protein